MESLKAEIEKKKRQLLDKNIVGPQKKYFKRGELIQKREEEYWEKEKLKAKDEEDDYDYSGSFLSSYSKKEQEEERVLPRKEVIRRLRERLEPITLYAETEVEAFQRLRRLEILEPESNRGFRNDFQEAMEKVDQAYMDEILKSQGKTDDGKSVHDVKVEEETSTMEDIQEMAQGLGKNNEYDSKVILTFLKFLLQVWGRNLNSRSEEDKMSVHGKLASATYAQTMDYIKPLFKKLRSRTCLVDILDHLVLIIRALLEKNYVKASDAYLEMAIGNAPWPIGVTMVGIHARTGREKIFSQNIAHVLNDETQRKFIQALKRLMTQCQRFFPTDPSRCVEYNA